jgi:TonB family protein
MKKMFLMLLILASYNMIAQKKATYIKMERTACFGRCPVYSVELFSNGKIKYTGTRNVANIGTFNYKVSAQKVKSIFAYIEKNKISSLKNKYEEIASDLPRLHMKFLISKKAKAIQNAEAGPFYLQEIASRVDVVLNELLLEKFPAVEKETVIMYGEEGSVVLIEEEKVVEPEVFTVVEQMPEFPGGQMAMIKYLNEKIVYPESAKDQGIQGKVIVNFIVHEDGNITSVKAIKSLNKECDAEAIRVISNMPKWKAGMQNGKPVKTQMNLPINFKLN